MILHKPVNDSKKMGFAPTPNSPKQVTDIKKIILGIVLLTIFFAFAFIAKLLNWPEASNILFHFSEIFLGTFVGVYIGENQRLNK